MQQYLQEEGYASEYLTWYVNYCCRDDYGSTTADVSAYAGIHYFASRRGIAANAPAQSVLTWSEGNNFLVKQLMKTFSDKIKTHHLVSNVDEKGDTVIIKGFNWKTNKTFVVESQQVILAIPQFVANRLIQKEYQKDSTLQYPPWMVANIVLKNMNDKYSFCWDNVIYNSRGLGYVNATHQRIEKQNIPNVLTYYYPLSHLKPSEARKWAMTRKHEEWVMDVLEDLKDSHPEIENHVEKIDIKVWGHGMVSPAVGTFSSEGEMNKNINNKIFFAHSDLSGISIFEEAFYWGHTIAETISKKHFNPS
jgi:hypothetical protein